MKKIVLDGKLIDSRKKLYDSVREQMQSEVFVGSNLDAFHDALTEAQQVIELEILNAEFFQEHLGFYADRFLRVYQEYRQEFKDKHIPGAINIPNETIGTEEITEFGGINDYFGKEER